VTWQAEGSCGEDEYAYLRGLAHGMRNVAEIGFNYGYSARAMLDAGPDVRVTSFDIGIHDCVRPAKRMIDIDYPGRHSLIVGDSRETVPAWTGERFDLLFVDGGHDYETVRADLANAPGAVRPGGLVMIDDLTPWKPWGAGPAKAWQEFVASGAIRQIDLRMDREPVSVVPESGGPHARVWALGTLP
jgi:predicted O-methyltransferase YrrM